MPAYDISLFQFPSLSSLKSITAAKLCKVLHKPLGFGLLIEEPLLTIALFCGKAACLLCFVC